MTLWQSISYKIKYSQSKLMVLIGINIAVFLLINIAAVFEFLIRGASSGLILSYANNFLAMPSAFSDLATRFWTPLTYMFMHAGLLHILFNMLWLYWMGLIFEDFLGKSRTVALYIMGGLGGALLVLLAYNFIPVFANSNITLVGASASVMAIIVAAATIVPNYSIHLLLFGPVKLKWLALAYVLLSFLVINGGNAGGQIAHLGGALVGFIYVKRLQRGNDFIARLQQMFKPRPKMRVVSKNTDNVSKNYPAQDEIDRILDKISQSGYDNLTRQEKEILFRASKDEQ